MQSTSRIFAGVSGPPGSMHALCHAAGLACHHDALLIPLLTWVPPEGDSLLFGAGRRGPLRRLGCPAGRHCLAMADCRCRPSHSLYWPRKQAMAFAAGRSGTAKS